MLDSKYANKGSAQQAAEELAGEIIQLSGPIIVSLTEGYDGVFLVDVDGDRVIDIRTSAEYDAAFPRLDADYGYQARVEAVIAGAIVDSEKDRVAKELDAQHIYFELIKRPEYFCTYKAQLADGGTTYFTTRFLRVASESGRFFILGVRNADAEVREKLRREEEIVMAKLAAEQVEEAKAEFMTNVSHDFRTPLNASIGFTNMALESLDCQEKLKDCLYKVQKSNNLLSNLLNNVMDVNRIGEGKVIINESKADMLLIGTEFLDTMKELAAAKDIALSFDIKEIRDRYVYVDFVHTNRILVNVITNAIKYTPEGGQVSVEVSQTDVTTDDYGEYQFVIKDNGIGMSEEFQTKMFDEFSREEGATLSNIQGSGLGLSVAKALIELLGGSIDVASTRSVGTTIAIKLPFRLQEGKEFEAPISPKALAKVSLEGKKVLVVEDNDLNREIEGSILLAQGMVVEAAEDGKLALDILDQKGIDFFDIILMDIQMPVMNGYEVTRKIRQKYPDSKVPIIALSANAFEEDKRMALEVGMNDHQSKPIVVPELINSMKKCLLKK